MNILFIIPSLGGGGAEKVTSIIASKFSEKNNVYILTYYEALQQYEICKSIETICLDISDGNGWINKIRNSYKRIKEIRKYKRTKHIDVSISMLFSPNFENVMSRQKEKVIISLRNKMSAKVSGYEAVINRYTCSRADSIVAVCENVLNDQALTFGTPKQRMKTIYNPCNRNDILIKAKFHEEDPLFEEIKARASNITISVGRLTKQKAHAHLIRAFTKHVKKNPNSILLILGEGELKDDLLKLISQEGLQKNIYLMGYKKNPYYYMINSDLFVLSSIYEGFANVLLEAMACDLPIVACDCIPGPRELLAPNTDFRQSTNCIEYGEYGILTPMCSGKKYSALEPLETGEIMLEKAITQVLKEPELRNKYKEKSQERISDFSVETIMKKWEELIYYSR